MNELSRFLSGIILPLYPLSILYFFCIFPDLVRNCYQFFEFVVDIARPYCHTGLIDGNLMKTLRNLSDSYKVCRGRGQLDQDYPFNSELKIDQKLRDQYSIIEEFIIISPYKYNSINCNCLIGKYNYFYIVFCFRIKGRCCSVDSDGSICYSNITAVCQISGYYLVAHTEI